MKKFAFFLPQFHTIPENDMWWGKGFTEWTNVRGAEPLYKGHVPAKPINGDYYNLLEKSVMEHQTETMKKYGIDGLIYYHYYFEGKKLLEKPAENLLQWKDIPQRFFFCWANHDWQRTWDGSKEMLVRQTYGNEQSWEKHFQYLLPFFKDERYEKKRNKPVFMIFLSDFKERDDLFFYFNNRCIEEGFDGIFLIETYQGDSPFEVFLSNVTTLTQSVFFREPSVSQLIYLKNRPFPKKIADRSNTILRKLKLTKKPRIMDGKKMMLQKIKDEPMNERIIHGIWFEWDSTPRYGSQGYIITPYEQELFVNYMKKVKNDEYLFINAWNEWGEGMILEPTQKDGYKYLEWIEEWNNLEKS